MTVLELRRPHRPLVYCDDSPRPLWGWWCRDCPDGEQPYTESKNAVENQTSRHRRGLDSLGSRPRAESLSA